jgi:pyruvate kinase
MTPSSVAPTPLYEEEQILEIIRELTHVRDTIITKEEASRAFLDQVCEQHYDSARNLIRYLALRTFNLRHLQAELSKRGLSSIGTSERYTLANIDNVLHLLYLIIGRRYYGDKLHYEHKTTVLSSWEKLQRNTNNLFGKNTKQTPHIMVTMPTEAADNYELVCQLLNSGMNVARINCGHDDEVVWKKMIDNIRKGEADLGKSCKVYMDLAGPKIRTGEVAVIGKKKKGRKVIDYLSLEIGDPLHLHGRSVLGRNAVHSKDGDILLPAKISITLPQVFEGLKEGQPIWFDDGKIGAVVKMVKNEYALLEITHTGLKGGQLRAEKGINLPETDFRLPSLTDDDLAVLPFIAQHADIVGYSFVRYPVDVDTLRQKLLELGRPDMGMVLKIENKTAFNNLPALLLTAMKRPAVGVMIARGDLAVEVGWERISEVQEEILWICEAAHVPIIWATQVLESLAKKGTASRAEITDAAMANRAECVMLNKGPFIFEAVQLLENILHRMYAHQWKKKETLRTLHVAERFFDVAML